MINEGRILLRIRLFAVFPTLMVIGLGSDELIVTPVVAVVLPIVTAPATVPELMFVFELLVTLMLVVPAILFATLATIELVGAVIVFVTVPVTKFPGALSVFEVTAL